MDTLSVGNEYAADTGNSEYAFCDVVDWLNKHGYSVCKFYTRTDADNDPQVEGLMMSTEDGLFIKESLV